MRSYRHNFSSCAISCCLLAFSHRLINVIAPFLDKKDGAMTFSYRLVRFFSHPMRISCGRRFLRFLIPWCWFFQLRRCHLISSSHPLRLAFRSAPRSRLRFELIKTARADDLSGTTGGTKNGPPLTQRRTTRKTKRDMRLNETLLTIRHPKRHYPVSEENQEYENANTRIAPASS